MPKRDWEDAEGAALPTGGRRRWEDDDDDDDNGSSDAGDVDGMPPPLDDSDNEESPEINWWEEMLVEFMLDLLLARTLSARQFCVIMYFVGKCGIQNAIRFGKAPGAPSGHYNRHIKRKFGYVFQNDHWYRIKAPGRKKHELGRVELDVVVAPVWEQLDADLRKDPSSLLKLEEAIADNKLPPTYDSHPLVVDHGAEKPVWPVHLFVDGVPYSHTDSVIGWWIVCAVTSRRYFIGALRKKSICQCGCRGWCTFSAYFMYIAFILGIFATGEFPTVRHDGEPWAADEAVIAGMAGKYLLFRICLIFVKGDWAEYAGTLGFPTWGDSVRPCFCCNASLWDLYNFGDITGGLLPWRSNQEGEYFTACRRCEINVEVPANELSVLQTVLKYDKRSHGNKGL